MRFNHVNRRLHLYLALALLPWFLMYTVTSMQFSHPDVLGSLYKDGTSDWQLRLQRKYDAGIDRDADAVILRDLAGKVLADLQIDMRFGVSPVRADGTVQIWCFSFLKAARVTYDVDKRTIKVEDRRFRMDHFLSGMHARGGFQHDGFLDDLWAVVVDLVCVAFLLWIATGLYMWWKLPRLRRWGWVALAAGATTFTAFMLGL